MSPKDIEAAIKQLPPFQGRVETNERLEYGSNYRDKRGKVSSASDWQGIEKVFEPSISRRREIVLLGTAGERVLTAGTLLAHAAILAGMHVTQKNDYAITIMRGPSVAEVIVSPEPITYTGVEKPDFVAALSEDGVRRARDLFDRIRPDGLVISAAGVEVPATAASIEEIEFKAVGIKKRERALATLALLAKRSDPVTVEMLTEAITLSFHGKRREEALEVIEKTSTIDLFGISG
jgi:Pyruvate/2-oxoacid:ferredoxin oxidoreductase gamma subunit